MATQGTKRQAKTSIIAAFDVGKTTGYAFQLRRTLYKGKESSRIKSGSGNPFEVAEELRKHKDADDITLVFYYDMSFLGPRTTSALERYKRYVIEPLLFKSSDIRILMFQESTVFRGFTKCVRTITSKEKKEITAQECRRSQFNPANYDEADAIQLLLYYINHKNLPAEGGTV